MNCQNPRCLGNFNFNHIAFYARKRFVEGISTMVLLCNANSEREKEEIALVALLDVEDDMLRDLQLTCDCTGRCKAIDCRRRLKKIIAKETA